MTRTVTLGFIFHSLFAAGQTQVSLYPVYRKAVTGFGNPSGKKTEKQIDKSGGRLLSSDGIVELIFPEGALKKTTTISIQPVVNKLSLGEGKAYQMEPSSMEFIKPAQIVFHYDNNDAEGEMQSLMGIAMQDEKGKWFELFDTELDTVKKTVSGLITHFSVWSKFMELKLYPKYTRLKVGKTITLNIMALRYDLPEEKPAPLVKKAVSVAGGGNKDGSGKEPAPTWKMEIGEIEIIEESGGNLTLVPPTADDIEAANPGVFDDGSKLVLTPPTVDELEAANPGVFDSDAKGPNGEVEIIIPNPEDIIRTDEPGSDAEVKMTIGEAKRTEGGQVEISIGDPKEAGNEVDIKIGDPKRKKGVPDEKAASDFLKNWNAEWMVNGIKGGNSTFGSVTGITHKAALFVAPKLVPDENPVTVTVILRGATINRKGKTISGPNLQCKIFLYDNAYKIETECKVQGMDAGTRLGESYYTDAGSFLVELKKDKAEIKDIRNQPDYWTYKGSCSVQTISPDIGMVHIGPTKQIKVIPPPNEQSAARVEIEFVPQRARLSKILIACKDGPALPFGGGWGNLLAYPMFVNFEAKEGKQVVLQQGEPGGQFWVLIKARKLSDKDIVFQ